MNYRTVARKLRKLGCQELHRQSGGSHRTWYNPATGTKITVPDWGSKDLKMGTLRSVIRRLNLDWEAFKQA